MKKILIVDDEPNNLQVLRQILKDHYQLIFANNGNKCLEVAPIHQPDLILLDIMMPDINGYEVCEQLKNNPETQNIPVIFVSAMSDVDDEAKGFDVGAVDYIQKPVSAPIVLRRIKTHLSMVRAQELEQSQKAAIYMLGEAGHYNDTDTGDHIWRMAAYARALAEAAGWTEEQAEWLELAAPMHDTGKIGTPDSILKAPRKLTPDEWSVMQQHSEIGYGILSVGKTEIFRLAAEIARYHHEKWDGSGYPHSLSGTDIPESARIVAIADVFDALTMKRPYKDAWKTVDAIQEIKRGAGNHFDPDLVDLFEQILPEIIEIKYSWQLHAYERTDKHHPE
jgi:putative two-component system response regulator